MPLQIAVGAYFVLFLPSEVSKMGLFNDYTNLFLVDKEKSIFLLF